MKRIYGATISAVLFALGAWAQGSGEGPQAIGDAAEARGKQRLDDEMVKLKEALAAAEQTATVVRTEGGVMSDIKNAPYRADQVTETTQTLGDGTRIHNERRITIYRDTQGRVRRELQNDQVSIWDPNLGVTYNLNSKDLTYRKMQVFVSSEKAAAKMAFTTSGTVIFSNPVQSTGKPGLVAVPAPGGGRGGLSLKGAETSSLGTQTMEGVSVQGQRQTSTIEAGAIGNDRPIQIVTERWYSPDLQLNVMTRHDDPRTGEEITRLINISRAEPDPSLFQVPAGYQLIEPKQLPAIKKMPQQ